MVSMVCLFNEATLTNIDIKSMNIVTTGDAVTACKCFTNTHTPCTGPILDDKCTTVIHVLPHVQTHTHALTLEHPGHNH